MTRIDATTMPHNPDGSTMHLMSAYGHTQHRPGIKRTARTPVAAHIAHGSAISPMPSDTGLVRALDERTTRSALPENKKVFSLRLPTDATAQRGVRVQIRDCQLRPRTNDA